MKLFEGNTYTFMFQSPRVASINDITDMLLLAEDILHIQCEKITDEITKKETMIQQHLQKVQDEMENAPVFIAT